MFRPRVVEFKFPETKVWAATVALGFAQLPDDNEVKGSVLAEAQFINLLDNKSETVHTYILHSFNHRDILFRFGVH